MSAEFLSITSAAGILIVTLAALYRLAGYCNPEWAIKQALNRIAALEKRKEYLKREKAARQQVEEDFIGRGSELQELFGVAPPSRQIAAPEEAERA